MPSSTDTAIAELRRADETVARFAPVGFERDTTDIRRRLGLMIAALIQGATAATCRRCGGTFSYRAATFARRRMPAPRHCYACRQVCRAERRIRSASMGEAGSR